MSAVAFDKVVPLGQEIIFDDMPINLIFKEWAAFFLCLIDFPVDRCEYCEASRSSCLGSHFAGFFDGVEDSPAPNSGDLREEPVFNGVPLGTVGRIMGNSDVNAQLLRGLNEAPFEQPAPCAVRTAAVTEDEYALCAWIYMSEIFLPLLHEAVTGKLCRVMAYPEGHVTRIPLDIVDAVGHHLAVGERGIVVVVYLHGLGGIGTATVPPERAKEFLFLRVHAEYGNTVLLTVCSQLLNLFELLVTQLTVCHWQCLYRLASGVPLCLYDLPDGIGTYLYMVLPGKYQSYLRRSKAKPLCIGILWKPCYIELHNLAEDGDILGMDGKCALPAASFLADSALVKMLFGVKFTTASVNGVTGYAKDTTDKFYAMPAIPFCYDGEKLPCLPLICILEVFPFFACYYICWIIRYLHSCLEISYKDTNFPADSRMCNVNNQ